MTSCLQLPVTVHNFVLKGQSSEGGVCGEISSVQALGNPAVMAQVNETRRGTLHRPVDTFLGKEMCKISYFLNVLGVIRSDGGIEQRVGWCRDK